MLDYADKALGMVETRGLIAAIEAADAMVKAAEVTILGIEQTVAALMTVHAVGETAAVQAAVDAGAAAASRVGDLVSAHVIPRPAEETYSVVDSESFLTPARPKGGAGRKSAARTVRSQRASPRPAAADTQDLESLTVRELRQLARQTSGFPIHGREIARANKKQLLDAFRSLG